MSPQQPPPHSVFFPAIEGSPGFSALPLLWSLVGARLSIAGSQLAIAYFRCRVTPLVAMGFSLSSGGSCVVKGVLRVCGLTESKRRKEKEFWIQSSQMTYGKPQVTAEGSGALRGRHGGNSDSGGSLMGLRAHQPIGCLKGRVIKLLRTADTNLCHPSKFACKTTNQPCLFCCV